MPTIKVQSVYKIFGPNPDSVLPRVREGASKAEILEDTGHTVGLRDVSLTMESGRIFVVMGLSGSGKSTLIRHLNRLIEPTAGHIFVGDEDVMSMSSSELRDFRRRRAAMVFQRFGLMPHQSVLKNIAYGLAIQGLSAREWDAKARHWIEMVGLEGYENAYPAQLSGGMQQRVGLARALATDPEILLMDEAFSALDPLIRTEMQDQLIHLQQELHKTIVFITHDLDEALRLGDQVAILRDGEVIQVGEPQEIVLNPVDEYIRNFAKNVNRSRVLMAQAVMTAPPELFPTDMTMSDALHRLETDDEDYAYAVDADGRFRGIVTALRLERLLREGSDGLAKAIQEIPVVRHDQLIEECLGVTAQCRWPVPVIDDEGRMQGVLSPRSMVRALTGSDRDGAAAAPGSRSAATAAAALP